MEKGGRPCTSKNGLAGAAKGGAHAGSFSLLDQNDQDQGQTNEHMQ